ncbi:MAG: phosphatase PAP2 family protein [Hydrogenophaga sp.]|nr:phosphatase PAP2 family protein [Hydrogenophaga sp.]
MLATLAWDASGLDRPVMHLIGTQSGFPWQHEMLLERVLHDGLRQVAWVCFGVLVIWAVRRDRVPTVASPTRPERLTVLGLIVLSLIAINVIKAASRTSCPWDWADFGGPAAYVSHWDLFTGDGGRGRCFPGGHASSGLAYLALALPWLWSPAGPRRKSTGVWWLLVALGVGAIAGAAQTLRGAHPPSHTLWTAVICSAVALLGWRLSLPRLRRAATAIDQDAVNGATP